MDLKEIKELIALMKKNDLSAFKMERDGFKIALKRGADFQPVITSAAPVAMAAPAALAPAGVAPAPAAAPAAPASNLKEITSPMVGTFYVSPSPESAAFAPVGKDIGPENVVCIIEAMKVMNEIKAECSGKIVEIVAENGKPVQYGQVLFRVQPA